jgi:hypothetical protein
MTRSVHAPCRQLFCLATLIVGLAACGSSTETKPVFAAVVGLVSDASGTPLAGVTVRATSFFDTCRGLANASNDATTDVSGHYRIRLTSGGGANPACVTATAVRLLNGVRDSALISAMVHFDFDRLPGDEDSVRADLRLP